AAAVPLRAAGDGGRGRRPLRRLQQAAAVLRDAARRRAGTRPVAVPGGIVSAASSPGLWPVLSAVFAGAAALLGAGTLLARRVARRHRERFEQAVGARMRESFLFVDAARLFVLQHVVAVA